MARAIASRAAATALAAIMALAGPVSADGGEIYAETCAVCHMPSGGGVPYMQPALAGTATVNGDIDALIARVLMGSAATPGAPSDYSNEMPGFPDLSDDDVAQVLSHIRSSFGNQSGPVTAQDVARVRKDRLP